MLSPHQVGLKMIKSASRRAIRPHQGTINEAVRTPFEALSHKQVRYLLTLENVRNRRRRRKCEFGLGEGKREN